MSRPTILCIDDEPLSIRALESYLSKHYRVSTALSAKQGLELIEQESPDLIIADVLMPDMNGFEMVSKLRQSPESKNIPLIFISALAQLGNVGKSSHTGATQFFSKPVDMSRLLVSIQKLIG